MFKLARGRPVAAAFRAATVRDPSMPCYRAVPGCLLTMTDVLVSI